MRRRIYLPSYKLDYVTQLLGLGAKQDTGGHELWMGWERRDRKAINKMIKYCKHDVVLLEKLYHKLLPLINNHPNLGMIINPNSPVCTNCGSKHIQKRGKAYTNAGVYQRYSCSSCGTWMRSRFMDKPSNKQVALKAE